MTLYFILTAFGSFTLGFLLAAFLCGAKKANESAKAAGDELDAARLNYLDETHGDLLYNADMKSWGVVSRDRKFVYAARTVRAALDGARHDKAVRVQS
jgi:hypothetical protein